MSGWTYVAQDILRVLSTTLDSTETHAIPGVCELEVVSSDSEECTSDGKVYVGDGGIGRKDPAAGIVVKDGAFD